MRGIVGGGLWLGVGGAKMMALVLLLTAPDTHWPDALAWLLLAFGLVGVALWWRAHKSLAEVPAVNHSVSPVADSDTLGQSWERTVIDNLPTSKASRPLTAIITGMALAQASIFVSSCGPAAPQISSNGAPPHETFAGPAVCLRVPTENELDAAKFAIMKLSFKGSIAVKAALQCDENQETLYIVKAYDKGTIYERPNYQGVPAEVYCCHGEVPLELNPSILSAPLYYFALKDEADRAWKVAKLKPGMSFRPFDASVSLRRSRGFDRMNQPGYVIFASGRPNHGICVIISNLADRLKRYDLADYSVRSQVFACVAKLLGAVDVVTPRTPVETARIVQHFASTKNQE